MSDQTTAEVENAEIARLVDHFQNAALREAVQEFASKHGIKLEEEK